MSRHRNIRTQNYDDYDDTDEYGKSFEEETGVSPGTVSQFMYRRDDTSKNANRPPTLLEEETMEDEAEELEHPNSGDTAAYVEIDHGRMTSCTDYIDSCTGDAFSRDQIRTAIISANYNAERALQLLLEHDGNVPALPATAKPPLPLAKKFESLSVTRDSNVLSPNPAVKQPERLVQKLTPNTETVQRVAAYRDPTISTHDRVTKLKMSSVKLPDWAMKFVSDANHRYQTISERISATNPAALGPLPDSVTVSADKKGFPRPESTPNLRLLDPGRSVPGTPTPGSPKSTRKSSKGTVIPARTASRTDDGQGDPAVLLTAKTPEVPVVPSRSLIKITALYEQRQSSSKPLLNLIVIGHVDAGKSTLMGHLLFLLGRVDAKQMAKFEYEAKKIGKSSFMYAWVLDETTEERARGVTIDVAQTSFETTNKVINLMDAPGHKDFIPNMITGTAQADVAVLVVDATRGEFETGFQSGGQTREHTLLARSLGVSQLVVAVNKMDNVDWSQARFDQIVEILVPFFKAVGFKESDVSFVPCSGFTGDNLIAPPKNVTAGWVTGPSLVTQLDNFRLPVRQIDKPYRQVITDVFKSASGGFSVAGKIEAGHIQTGDRVTLMPAAVSGVAKSITMDSGAALNAFAGDNVIVALTGVDILNVHVGDILCDPSHPVPITSRLRARIALFTPKVPLLAGQECVFHNQAYTESCVIRKLLSQINRNTGEIQKKNPRMLTKNTSGEVELSLLRPVCAELYSVSRELGRFMLRDSGTTIAAGVITEILPPLP